ncbi:RNA-directed DNA polymerase [Bacteroides fragilis]|uniref:RNA-directed DNA polymerase n=1 Tax=Bacteroides fragilis TaxID=817 RepID=UPI00333D6199
MIDNKLFTFQQIYEAYRKLKSYIYYDNTSLFIRKEFSSFESSILAGENFEDNFKKKMKSLYDILNSDNYQTDLDKLVSKIGYKLVPKSIKKKESTIVTNIPHTGKIEVESYNILIDAPIEIHIISVLWLIVAGKELCKYVNENNYAYKLLLLDESYLPMTDIKIETNKENYVVTGLQLYEPYFIGYQNWRDNALNSATKLLDDNKDATILSLDIQRYFYSVRIDLDSIKNRCSHSNKQIEKCFHLLQIINKTYTSKINKLLDIPLTNDELNAGYTILPIGLLSSGLLGNLYLEDFDKTIKEELNPAYYGRYVDDILFVFSDRKVKLEVNNPIHDFIDRYFIKKNILETILDENNITYLLPVGSHKLKIQSEKVILEHFNHKESRAAINIFKKNPDKNRSEFRFLPYEENIDNEFDNEAFSMHYSDSINKLRSIKEFKEDKYGASKFLAHKIFLSKISPNEKDYNRKYFFQSSKQILTFFKGSTALSLYTLWEKVATYFVINNESKCLIIFYNQVLNTINNIKTVNGENKIKEDLKEFLFISIAMPISMRMNIKIDNNNDDVVIHKLADDIRKTNMFRQNLLGISCINYTDYIDHITNDLFHINIKNIKDLKIQINIAKFISPRFVHYHEFNILNIYQVFSSINKESDIRLFDKIQDIAFNQYKEFNYDWRFLYSNTDPIYPKDFFTLTQSENSNCKNINILEDNEVECNKKIGLANIEVSENDILSAIKMIPNISKERRKRIFEIMNYSHKKHVDLVVLPEVSVPFEWIDFFAEQSKNNNIAFIIGLEHVVSSYNFAYNFTATILPIKQKEFTTCLVRIRLKNYYSHSEKELLKGYRLINPSEIKPELKLYDLFHWRKSYFSVYNCFELANISDRALFKSKLDFIVATEYNKDINYFSDIAGSWVRDLHCFFVQANSSQYGDSRIVQPAKSDFKNMISVKGGKHPVVLIDELQIDKLRDFQNKEYNLQKELIDKEKTHLKPTPPDFNKDNVLKRIKDEPI